MEEVDGSHLLSTAVNSGWYINMSIGKCNNKLFFDQNTTLTSGPIAGLSVGRVAGLLNRASPHATGATAETEEAPPQKKSTRHVGQRAPGRDEVGPTEKAVEKPEKCSFSGQPWIFPLHSSHKPLL